MMDRSSIDVRYDVPMSTPPLRAILASQSPRRRRLLEWLGFAFDCTSVDTPEDLDSPLASNPPRLAMALAAEKAEAAMLVSEEAGDLILCFDTIVAHEGRVLGKPVDEADAWRMLRELSGDTHQVVTGAAIVCPGQTRPHLFSAVTNVTMHDLDDERIREWMGHGTFMGCAGAYNIEAQVAHVTTRECYQNVAGLPLCHLYAQFAKLPAHCKPAGLQSPIAACDAALGRRCELGPEVTGG